jgi:hypothetical protein
VAVAVLAAMLIGFLSGLLSFKVKSRWCTTCGRWTHPCVPAASTVENRPVASVRGGRRNG